MLTLLPISPAFRAKIAASLLPLGAMLLMSPHAHAVAVGDMAPECVLSSLAAGKDSRLSQYRGKIVYVDFWASWCGPCAQSFPFLNALHQQYQDQGLQIVGVNMDESKDEASAFLAKIPAEFTIAVDTSKQCATDFAVQAMPSSYIIDRKGRVHHIHLGFRDGAAEELRTTVEQLLKAK